MKDERPEPATPHQVPPEVIRLHCTCATLRRASRVVTSFYDQELRSLGLRTTQYTVLQVLSGVGEVSQKTLGEILGADSTTLTRNLRRLDQEGWIVSRPGEDRRQRLWSLTGSGREVLEEARPLWKRAQERFEEALGDDWRRLHGLLDHTTAALQEA